MDQRIVLPAFPVEGGCYCGAVRYRLSARPLGVYRCHCKDCQRFSGAAWQMSMMIRRNTLEVIAGTTSAYDKTADSGRVARMHACPTCGTKLFNEPLSAPDLLVLKPGTLDDSSWAVPAGNIWVESALPWVALEPDLPSFPGQPASRDALYVAWDQMVEETA
jgi:hypothetical protein